MKFRSFVFANPEIKDNIQNIVKYSILISKESDEQKKKKLNEKMKDNIDKVVKHMKSGQYSQDEIDNICEDMKLLSDLMQDMENSGQFNSKDFGNNYKQALNQFDKYKKQVQQNRDDLDKDDPDQDDPDKDNPDQDDPDQDDPDKDDPDQDDPDQDDPDKDDPDQNDPDKDDPDQNDQDQNGQNQLPLISGLQVYNKVLQEVGKIKGTKSLKWERFFDHLGFPAKQLIAGPIRLFSGRKKETKRISEVIDNFDFEGEFGLSKEKALNLMLDDCLLKGGEGRGIIKLKVNDIFLKGLTYNLNKGMDEKTQVYNEKIDEITEAIQKLEEAKQSADPAQVPNIEHNIDILNSKRHVIVEHVEYLMDQPRKVDRAREDKSYNKRDNIKGADAAVRDLDSREVIKELASIEMKKLEAERDGNTADVHKYERKMNEYMNSKTAYKKGFFGIGTISIGEFEAPIGKPKIVSNRDYMFIKNASAIGKTGVLAAATLSRQIERLSKQIDLAEIQATIQEKQNMIDAQTNAHNQLVEDINVAKGRITTQDADNAVHSVMDDAGRSAHIGERQASLIGGFNEKSQTYIDADASNLNAFNVGYDNASTYIQQNTGSQTPLDTFIDSLFKKAEIQSSLSPQVQAAQDAAQMYYNNGDLHLISNAGLDHTTQAGYEMFEQASAFDSNIATLQTCGDVLKSLRDINASQVQGVDFTDLQQALNNAGVKLDLFPLIAEGILGYSHINDMNSKNKEAKSLGGVDYKEK